jgi:hypothetical protein
MHLHGKGTVGPPRLGDLVHRTVLASFVHAHELGIRVQGSGFRVWGLGFRV